MCIENRDLLHSVQSSLDLHCSCSTAGTYNGHLFADHIDIVILQCLHKTDAIGNMSG